MSNGALISYHCIAVNIFHSCMKLHSSSFLAGVSVGEAAASVVYVVILMAAKHSQDKHSVRHSSVKIQR